MADGSYLFETETPQYWRKPATCHRVGQLPNCLISGSQKIYEQLKYQEYEPNDHCDIRYDRKISPELLHEALLPE